MPEFVSYAYAVNGAKLSEANGNLTTTFVYDSLGRVVQQTESNGIVKTCTYDLAGNRATYVLKRNNTTEQSHSYTYDKLNRLLSVAENGTIKANYTYDVNGNRANLAYPANGITTTYAYNKANMVTSLINKKGNTVLSSFTYAYYLDGNQEKKTDNTGKVTTYLYDGLGRLTKETETASGSTSWSKTYTFDAAGNRATMVVTGADARTVTYAYDANNRLVKETTPDGNVKNGFDYYYDRNGNQTGKISFTVSPTVSGAQSAYGLFDAADTPDVVIELFVYDAFNQLAKVQNEQGIHTYAYKPDGLRLSKTTNGVTTTHIWDGSNIVMELNGITVVNKYVRGIGLIANQNGQYYIFNAHGDVVQLANAAGTVTKEYHYDSFGVEIDPDDNDTNVWRYCGEYYDLSSGTYYLRARYYVPRLGRFTQEDPMRQAGGSLNFYTYCNNNPILFIDPSGLVIRLTGTNSEKEQLFQELQSLTSDELYMDSDGKVTVATKNKNPQRPEGTELVRTVINEEETCTIQISKGTDSYAEFDQDGFMQNGSPGKGSDTTIYLDPTPNLKGTGAEGLPLFLVLGHELIHATRAMSGTVGNMDVITYYVNGNAHQAKREELYVTRIWSHNENNPNRIHITENSLRKENGLKPRKFY